MKKKIGTHYSREIKEKVVKSIVNGELWIEEAMAQFEIKDRRTVVAWLRKYVQEKSKVNAG